jgi:hypothetical protein
MDADSPTPSAELPATAPVATHWKTNLGRLRCCSTGGAGRRGGVTERMSCTFGPAVWTWRTASCGWTTGTRISTSPDDQARTERNRTGVDPAQDVLDGHESWAQRVRRRGAPAPDDEYVAVSVRQVRGKNECTQNHSQNTEKEDQSKPEHRVFKIPSPWLPGVSPLPPFFRPAL